MTDLFSVTALGSGLFLGDCIGWGLSEWVVCDLVMIGFGLETPENVRGLDMGHVNNITPHSRRRQTSQGNSKLT